MPTGRPSKYNSSINERLGDYLKSTGRLQTTLPTLEGFAEFLGIHTDTIQDWKEKYPEFSVSIKKILQRQKQQLMDDGLYGGKEVNSAMAIFLLKANHGMIEKQHTIVSGPNDEAIQIVQYGNEDTIQLRPQGIKPTSTGSIETPGEVQGS